MPKFDPLDIFARNFDARTSDFEAPKAYPQGYHIAREKDEV